MSTHFIQLNHGWNAEPNAPEPNVSVVGDTLTLEFYANPYLFPQFGDGQRSRLIFSGAWRYFLGGTNDEGWYRGQCRFSGVAPSWGEFYEVSGDLKLDEVQDEWQYVTPQPTCATKHYLFYLRDDTFECDAKSWNLVT
jgi:hypothetical protein